MNRADVTGDCPGVADSPGSVWDSIMGPFLDWPLLLGMLTAFGDSPWCLWTVCVQNLTQGLCHTCSGGRLWTQASALSCVALSVALQLSSLVCTVGPPWVL